MAKKKDTGTPDGVPVAETIVVDGKTVRVKFGGHIPGMKTYTKEELLADPEAVAYLIEIQSGCIEILSNEA
ncbi:hypothetical protein [Mucilaginibacter sp.]|uniref:hypothetical protein n=1 Tax=Mucilaginibacter sp. TaxID=1882438 RepID=UPI00261F976F|nr:hypothetical protein [Mucilaginibacter sp.]MDB4919838.1 hypothetical protein [Mucilaginibacter sp.]